MTLSRFTTFVVALFGSSFFSACSSYEGKWKDAGHAERFFGNGYVARPRDPFVGRWEGRWTSNRHRTRDGYAGGRLRCIFRKVDDRHYEARFKANWMIFASSYRTVLDAERRGGVLQLVGEHRLASVFGGGVYKYSGRVTPERFSARYDAAYDSGTFEMRRPESGR